jgi:hypothetical protein
LSLWPYMLTRAFSSSEGVLFCPPQESAVLFFGRSTFWIPFVRRFHLQKGVDFVTSAVNSQVQHSCNSKILYINNDLTQIQRGLIVAWNTNQEDDMNGLNTTEIATVIERFGAERCVTLETDTGDAFVVARIGQDRDGEELTRNVCRYRGAVAMLDEDGLVVTEGKSLDEVLAAA